jgi:hypothetical protein
MPSKDLRFLGLSCLVSEPALAIEAEMVGL